MKRLSRLLKSGYSGEDTFEELADAVKSGDASRAINILQQMDSDELAGMDAQFNDETTLSQEFLTALKKNLDSGSSPMWNEVAERIDVPNMYSMNDDGELYFG